MVIALSNIEIVLRLFLILAGLATLFGPLACVAIWILAPIDRAAKSREAPVRFSIGDFLCLFVMIQVPLAGVYQLNNTENSDSLWFATLVAWTLGIVIWYAGARTLSKAGVYHSGHRFVYLGLILPAAYYGLLPYTFLSWWLLFAPDDNPAFDNFTFSTWTTVIWWVLTGLYLLSAIFTRWMLKQPRLLEVMSSDDQLEPGIGPMNSPDGRQLATPNL
jgi:hypothetical protein